MIYTGYQYNLASTHGIIPAAQNEKFSFGWMDGTNWTVETFTADKRCYLLPSSDYASVRADYEVTETRDGYFEVKFLTPPTGLYCTGNYQYSYGFNNIVEFVDP